LTEQGVSRRFWWEVVQAATRVNYAQNLGVINGLLSMVSMAPEGAVSVKGGNWKIFEAWAQKGADKIELDTNVIGVHRDNTDERLSLSTRTAKDSRLRFTDYDEIIIATPYQFADLSPSIQFDRDPDKIPYVTLHVTLFTSPHLLSPLAFNLPATSLVPLVVLTTLPEDENPGLKTPYAGKAGFFSISTLRPIINPITGSEEYLYKIFSPEVVTPAFLSRILGIKEVPDRMKDFKIGDVSWLYTKVWKSYPVEYPRVTFEGVKLKEKIWYTGGMDSFISTMETNALMGMNVARLMVDGWIGEKKLGKAKL